MLAVVTELTAYREPCLAIDCPSIGREFSGPGTAARRACPAGQLLVAGLRVAVAMAVNAVDATPGTLVDEMLQVGPVGRVTGTDKALALGERLGLLKKLSLFRGSDGNLA